MDPLKIITTGATHRSFISRGLEPVNSKLYLSTVIFTNILNSALSFVKYAAGVVTYPFVLVTHMMIVNHVG